MAKMLSAKSIANIGNIRFGFDSDGNLNELLVSVEVNYGTFGVTENVSLADELTSTQKKQIAELFASAKSKIEKKYLS